MSTPSNKIFNRLLSGMPQGVVLLNSWLNTHGYSPDIVKRYRHSGWLSPIGFGASIRSGDVVDCFGALYSLQEYCNSSIHIGARSAFSLQGKSHYLEFSPKKLILFSSHQDRRIPAWFKNFDWGIALELHASNFLPNDLGLLNFPVNALNIKISGEIRALMECLYLVPHDQELTECYELMESMNNVHPKKVQECLSHCRSIKVKRLFLYLAEKAKHEWFHHLDLSNIGLGSGKRKIVANGALDKKYKITVPKSWKNND